MREADPLLAPGRALPRRAARRAGGRVCTACSPCTSATRASGATRRSRRSARSPPTPRRRSSNAELYQRVALEKEQSVAILANVADGIVAVDRDGHVVLWNAAAERITGVPTAEALGRTPREVLHASSSRSGTARDRLVPILRGGEEVWLSLTEAVMRDPPGAVAGRIFAFRDISAERLVDQMKSEFVSTVSHELRTPLTSIYGFAETLLRRDIVLFGEEERETFLGYIASEPERLTSIVDALLNVARLDAATCR